MEESTTETGFAATQTEHTGFSGRTTTLPAGAPRFDFSTVSGNAASEFTAMVSITDQELSRFPVEIRKGHPCVSLGLWEVHIVERSDFGIYHLILKKKLNDGSTGLSQEEAEPCEPLE